MRKILLLIFFGGLCFSPQLFSALKTVSHAIASAYIRTEMQCTPIAHAETLAYKQSLILSLFTRLTTTYHVTIRGLSSTSIPDRKASGTHDAFVFIERRSDGHVTFIPRAISTHTSLHFNRLVNRKRILLSG
jgi:hypothetical protein